MGNRDNRNRHNRGGFKSIGSQVGSALGGHLSKQGKLGGGKGASSLTSKGNFSFNDFTKFVGNFFTKPGYASTMGDVTGKLSQLNKPSAWKIKQFADKNIDITNMNKSFKVDIDTNRAIQSIENEKVRNWLNKYTPQSVKDLKINHQMYSPTKVMPGDTGFNPTGTGSIKLDPETERYLEWMASSNPEGHTISDWEKLYANQIKEGMSLEQAMKHNPAETLSFYALIDDSGSSATDTTNTTTQTTNNNEPMAFDFEKYGIHDPTQFGTGDAQLSHNIDKIYQTLLGRNADSGGRTHWMGDVSSKGDSAYQALVNTILGGKEYKDRAAEVAANPNVTEQELDRLASAYVSPFHTYAGGAAAGYTPADDLTTAVAEAVSGGHQDQTNKTVEEVALANVLHNANNVNAADAINSTIGGLTGITGGVDTKVATDTSGGSGDGTWKKIHDLTKSVLGSGANDSTAAAKTSHTYKAGDTITTGNGDVIGVSTGDDNKAGGGTNVKTGDGSIVKIDANGKITFNGDDAVVNKDGTVTKTGTSSNWWDSYSDLAALKAALGIGNQTATNTTSDFDQFTKFIGALSGISGLFGGGGGNYGYGGYGGFNPGGVQQASSTDKMTGLLDAFKNMNSTSGGSSASTSTINV